jgi:hypothetical protein
MAVSQHTPLAVVDEEAAYLLCSEYTVQPDFPYYQ